LLLEIVLDGRKKCLSILSDLLGSWNAAEVDGGVEGLAAGRKGGSFLTELPLTVSLLAVSLLTVSL